MRTIIKIFVFHIFSSRPFSVQKIPHSNLILLVVDTLCPCGSKQLSITPQEMVYDNGNGGCLHKPKDSLYRRRPPKCINYHPEVSNNITQAVAIVFGLLVLIIFMTNGNGARLNKRMLETYEIVSEI